MDDTTLFKSGYADVNGLKMYYEIYGTGKPLVLIHGGGSTIETTFGKIIPFLSKGRQIIGVELQAHGHTNDRPTELSFEQDAADVAALCKHLSITKADFLGFSNGGQTVLELGMRYPELINKMVVASAFYERDAVAPQFWEGFEHVTIANLPQALKEGQLKANGNDTARVTNMFNRDVQRMKTYKGWTDAQIKQIKAHTLVINGNEDVASPEHAVKMYRTIPNCELAIFPGGHGDYLGAIETIKDARWQPVSAATLILEFLDKP